MHFKTLSAKAKALFFASLQSCSLDDVRRALSAHVCDKANGRYPPQPAHLVAQMDAMKGGAGRPGAEEAWAMSIAAGDEARTLVWTGEMREAFAICRPVFERGDEIGARMAFKDAYARLVAEAHRNGSRCLWEVSLGWDCGQRDKTLREAVSCGRLAHDAAAPFLVAPKESGCPDEGLAQSMPLRLASGTARSAAPQRSAAGWIESIRQTLAESVEKKKARREQAALRERERVDELKSASRAAAAAALRER